MTRITSRDYKRARSGTFDFNRYREFAYGLATGLAVALLVFVVMKQRADASLREVPAAKPEPRAAAAAADPGATPEDPGKQYDFYEMLPKFEVVVPEKDREVKTNGPAAPVERPGVYVLQAGSYRNLADAERVRKQLALQGMEASVQRVSVDTDVWHRVRIGPIEDLGELNRIRGRLRSADIDALVIRVGD